jgi:SsrA-binding protein
MKITNRKATYDYEIIETFEAGIMLTGSEVKSIRNGHADLTGSFAKIRGNEAYLVNASIFPYVNSRQENYDPKRTRKLLLHKKQILSLKAKMDGSNLTIVPLNLYTTRLLIKAELGIAKSKKAFQKKEAIKNRDIAREIEDAYTEGRY